MVKTLKKKAKAKAKKAVKKTMGKAKIHKRAAKRKIVAKKVMKKVSKKLVKKVHAKQKKIPGMIGKVVHYYDRIGVAILDLTAPVAVGDILLFKRGQLEFVQPVDSLQIDHVAVMKAAKGKVVGLKVSQVAEPGTVALKA